MSSKSASQETSKLDILKWVVVVAIVALGVVGNAYYAEQSFLYRVLALLVLAIIAGFVAFKTAKGETLWKLMKESRVEIRKVVWPTKAETRQTTLIVILVVFLVALLLWGLDSFLSWLVSGIIG